MRTGRRAVLIALLSAIGTLWPAGIAHAASEISFVEIERYGWTFIFITGDSGPNEVTVAQDDESHYIVSDTSGATPGERCVSVSSTTVRCSFYEDPELSAALGPGEDSISVRSGTFPRITVEGGNDPDSLRIGYLGPVTSKLIGGAGSDVLLGSPGHDVLRGGPGSDKIAGRKGNDELRGSTGADQYRGGGGRDHIYAADHDADETVACGKARDLAFVDRIDGRPAQSCERYVVMLPQ